MKIDKEIFGILADGSEADLFTLKHPQGSLVQITNYGAAVVSVKVPDKNGLIDDVVLGFDNLADFNLSGNLKDDILDHELMLNADYFLPVVKGLIPTGEVRSVTGTPLDFRKPFPIGARINEAEEQLAFGLGYDHNWIINDGKVSLKLAGTVYEPNSGRLMEIYTTEPGIQFYSGNFMDGSHSGHGGRQYNYRHALCLETQHYPDSPNHDNFPSTVIAPGEIYRSTTIYKFSVKE